MTTATSFTIGYHAFHPDVSINYQLNRFCDGSPASVAELTEAAPRINDYGEYTRELLALSEAADGAGRTLAAALYHRRVLATLLVLRARCAVNWLTARAMRDSPVVEWGLSQGMHTTGTGTRYDFLRDTRQYETGSASGRVTQDVLLLAGSLDHYVPQSQLTDQLDSLTAARSVTARLLTSTENAQNHVHVGNTELSLHVISTWMASLDQRGVAPLSRAETDGGDGDCRAAQTLGIAQQVAGDEVVGVFGQLVLGHARCPAVDRCRCDGEQEQAADGFEDAVEP